VWDYILFSDFLNEKHAHDELFFFLHCRQILFEGPQLLDSSSTHERTFKVEMSRVRKAVDIIFCKLTRAEKDDLFQKIEYFDEELKRVGKFKNAPGKERKIRSVDSAIVLKIFLEYYVREKKVRAFLLKRLFEEQPKLPTSSRHGISFDSFIKVLE